MVSLVNDHKFCRRQLHSLTPYGSGMERLYPADLNQRLRAQILISARLDDTGCNIKAREFAVAPGLKLIAVGKENHTFESGYFTANYFEAITVFPLPVGAAISMRLIPAAILASYSCNDLLLIIVEVHASPRRGFTAAPLKADRMVAMNLDRPPLPKSSINPFAVHASINCRSTSLAFSRPAWTN